MTVFGGVHVDIDWTEEGFGSATDAQSDVYNLTCSRGIGSAAQEGFVAAAGDATVTLVNRDGKYSRHNTASTLYPNVRGKKPIRLRLSSPLSKVFWVGQIDKIRAGARIDGAPTVVLSCKGNFIRLTDGRKVTPTSNPGDTTDVLLAALLDAAGIPSAEQDFAVGEITSGVWAPVNVGPLEEARRIVATELGRFYEAADGSFTFENRHYRRDTSRSNSVQITLSDDPGDDPDYRYREINQSDPAENQYDRIAVDFTPVYTVDGSPVPIFDVFGGSGSGQGLGDIIIPPGGSRTLNINPFFYPWIARTSVDDFSNSPGRYIVTVWQDPTVSGATPDIVAQGSPYADQSSLSISNIVTNAHSITFTLSNSDPTLGLYIGEIKLYGERAVSGARVQEVVGTGYREYPLPGPYYPEAGSALTAARWLYDYYSPPRDLLTVNLSGVRSPTLLTALMGREISDRIHVQATESHTNLALDDDFFLEGVAWQFQHGGDLDCTLSLSACLPNTHDTSEDTGLPTGALWYYPMNESSGDVVDVIDGYDMTRDGTVTDVGIIGPGQKFVSTEPDILFQPSAGPLDTVLTSDWEINGWVKRHSTTANDQVIFQKDLDTQAAARLSLFRSDATHFYLQGLIHTEDGDFTCDSSGTLVPVDTWCFVRFMHDSVAKTIAVVVNVVGGSPGTPASTMYTGTPATSVDGQSFGGTYVA